MVVPGDWTTEVWNHMVRLRETLDTLSQEVALARLERVEPLALEVTLESVSILLLTARQRRQPFLLFGPRQSTDS